MGYDDGVITTYRSHDSDTYRMNYADPHRELETPAREEEVGMPPWRRSSEPASFRTRPTTGVCSWPTGAPWPNASRYRGRP
jgi:hypothetical protein